MDNSLFTKFSICILGVVLIFTVIGIIRAIKEYADTLLTCVYDDFIGTAKKVLTPEMRSGLRKLLNFKFKKHPRYNLPPQRLKLIEKQIQERAKELLGES